MPQVRRQHASTNAQPSVKKLQYDTILLLCLTRLPRMQKAFCQSLHCLSHCRQLPLLLHAASPSCFPTACKRKARKLPCPQCRKRTFTLQECRASLAKYVAGFLLHFTLARLFTEAYLNQKGTSYLSLALDTASKSPKTAQLGDLLFTSR